MPASTQDLDEQHLVLDCRGHQLDCRHGAGPAHVMGILNVTPDSFYDGGRYLDADSAMMRVEKMLLEGAAIVDVGGESSRPRGRTYGEGAGAIRAEEESARVLPIVRAIADRFPEAIISVDTYKPEVAERALEAGAHMINDITGLRIHPEMATVAAAAGAPLIVMHSLGRPGEMPHEHRYDDVVADVRASLREAIETAEDAGVKDIVVDPGFGFGKSVSENLTLLQRVDALLDLGRPVLVGISRKSTIGRVLGTRDEPVPVEERLFGSLGATAVAVIAGATLVRTHDVRPTVEMLHGLHAARHGFSERREPSPGPA